jgi:hypothetical protein
MALNEVRSQKFVFETGIYALLQKRFPLKGEVLNPFMQINDLLPHQPT